MFFVLLTLSAITATCGTNLRKKGHELEDMMSEQEQEETNDKDNVGEDYVALKVVVEESSSADTIVSRRILKKKKNNNKNDDEEESEEEETNEVEEQINCQNNSTWTRESNPSSYKTCVWVSQKNPQNRCEKVDAKENCPKTCNDNCEDSVNYGGVEAEPEDEEPSACEDSSTWTRESNPSNSKNCDWVEARTTEKTKKRCKKDDAMENCPNTCNDQCPDSVNFPSSIPSGAPTKMPTTM